VAPILVAAPLYFAGKISFGGLMMAAAAFTQAQSSLRWFVITSVPSPIGAPLYIASRAFRYALTTTEDLHDFESRITYVEGEAGTITIDELDIVSPAGSDMLKERKVVVKAGERVLVVGAPGTGKTLLFRALAGLWPWGRRDRDPSERRDDALSAPWHALFATRDIEGSPGLSAGSRAIQ